MPGKTFDSRANPKATGRRFNEAPAKCRGKPPLPAELTARTRIASMRPQRNAGENGPYFERPSGDVFASMRPQRNAGENLALDYSDVDLNPGFNEAPAKCRGKRPLQARSLGTAHGASMRPQRNAGENYPVAPQKSHGRVASMRPQRNAGENRYSETSNSYGKERLQ